jgi:D-sedoheptulose 7-phosphate isomerase
MEPPTAPLLLGGAVLVQQVQALCQPGDVLLVFSLGDDSAALRSCVQAAHDKELTVVALITGGDSELAALLRETDVAVFLPVQRLARVLEQEMLILHCLCDAIDAQLLGEQDLG